METARRQHGKVYEGHTIPYGTFVGASDELKKVYYTHGYMRDEDLPELPCPPVEGEYVDPEEEMHKKEMVRVVEEVLDTLTPRAKKILCLRYGIGLTQDYTLEEVGLRFDVTRERIRQIEAKALRHMKHPYRSDKLRELLGVYESTAEKENEQKKLQRQWAKARENARLRDEAEKQAKAHAKLRAELFEKELEKRYQEDLRLRAKWEEIKPMVSDTDWVAHLKTANPAMYQELKYLVGDIWGYNAKKVWEMYAEKK
jgi:RNA polymerase sigma factor (sigma-70 family)